MFAGIRGPCLRVFGLLGLGLLCLGADGPPKALDQGQEVYQKLYRLAADLPDTAKAEALTILKQDSAQNQSEWFQAFAYLLNNQPDALDPALQTRERLLSYAATALKSKWPNIALQLQYSSALSEITGTDAESRQSALDREYLVKAEQLGEYRLAVRFLSKLAYAAYNLGDMKESLALIQRAYNHLDGRVPQDDTQMLEVKGNLASFLEYSGETKKAEDLYQYLVETYRQAGLRWALSDTLNNFVVLLIHHKRFHESEVAINEIMLLAKSLDSLLLQERALKSLGFAQALQGRNQEAVATYKKSLKLTEQVKEDPVAVADTYKIMAEAYVADKLWQPALDALAIADKEPTAMQDKNWERTIQDSRALAYAGLGRTAEALQAANRSNELLSKILQEEKEAALSKLKISMGLKLEEQKNSLLVDKLHDADILKRFFYGISALGLLVIILLIVALRETMRAKRSRERMHRILEHIEEGILSIGTGMRVEADLSPYLKRLVKAQGQRKPTEDIFTRLLNEADLSADARATIRSTLQACIGEESLAWELNAQQLPYEVSIHGGERYLRFEWQPIFGADQIIESILVTVRDVTTRKQLQTEVDTAKARASRLEQRLRDILQIDAVRAEAFVEEVRGLLPDVKARVEDVRDLPQCSRQLHTLKGVARTMGFHELSSLVHELEDQLDLENQDLRHRASALDILAQLEQTVQEYEDIIRKVFFRQNEATGRNAVSLVDLVANSLTPTRSLLERAGFQLAQVDIHDHIAEWPKAWLETINLVLLHGLTNSADHGFILPSRRGAKVTKRAEIQVTARPCARGMELELRDNGFGLDMVRLQAFATKTRFQPDADETIADVVFLDGVTTAEQVTRSSGRGVGMAAVRQAVEQLAGKVRLRPNPDGQGSSLWVQLPEPAAASGSPVLRTQG